MRVLHQDPGEGEIRLKIQNADDLWHLHNLLERGDLVRAYTYRREEAATDKLRPERGEKVLVKLGIRVEQTEYQDFSDRLRITGVIEEGPQDLGRHHTLNIGVDDDLTIVKKEWRGDHPPPAQEGGRAAGGPPGPLALLEHRRSPLPRGRRRGGRGGQGAPLGGAAARGDREGPAVRVRTRGGARRGGGGRGGDPPSDGHAGEGPRRRSADADGGGRPRSRRDRELPPRGGQKAPGARRDRGAPPLPHPIGARPSPSILPSPSQSRSGARPPPAREELPGSCTAGSPR